MNIWYFIIKIFLWNLVNTSELYIIIKICTLSVHNQALLEH